MKFLVDLHTHTVASDHAYSTICDYVNQAENIGLCMFATTDHGPSLEDAPHKWHFKNLRVVPRLANNIAILRGIEANVLKDGSIDIEKEISDKLDIVLCGFHPNYEPSNKEEHTKHIIGIIESGRIDVVTHLGQVRYPIDIKQVLECAKENNVAIEINSSSSVNTRLGSHENCIEIAKMAKKIGNTIALGSDAHIAYFLGVFDEAVKVIEESELGYDKIINVSPIKVLEFLESRGHSRINEIYDHFITI